MTTDPNAPFDPIVDNAIVIVLVILATALTVAVWVSHI